MLNWEEINRMGYSDLKKVASHYIRQANQRARRLEAKAQKSTGFYSPELEVFRKRGKPFTTRGKKYGELKSELKMANQFLNAKTSTIKGTKQYQKDVMKSLNLKIDEVIDIGVDNYISNFWGTVHKLNATPQFREWLAKNGYRYDDPQVKKYLQDNTDFRSINKSMQDIVSAIENNVDENYDDFEDFDDEDMWF